MAAQWFMLYNMAPANFQFDNERTPMFPEHRELISRLKTEDRRFERLFNEHNALDEKITELEKQPARVGSLEIDVMKKQKLALKDEIYQILRKASEQEQ